MFLPLHITNTHSDILKRKTDTNLSFQSHCTSPSSHDPPLGENKLLKHGHRCWTTKTKLRHRYTEKKKKRSTPFSIPPTANKDSWAVVWPL